MDQEPKPLYGELVIPFSSENQPNPPENESLEVHIRSMIEEAAYYLAEKRGFKPGHELEDWLEAKSQIIK